MPSIEASFAGYQSCTQLWLGAMPCTSTLRNLFSLTVQSTSVGWYRPTAQAGQGFPADAPYRSDNTQKMSKNLGNSMTYRSYRAAP
jgi:hypothetical protein